MRGRFSTSPHSILGISLFKVKRLMFVFNHCKDKAINNALQV